MTKIEGAIERADLEQLRSFARICAQAVYPGGDPDIEVADGEGVCGSDVIAEVSEAVHEIMWTTTEAAEQRDADNTVAQITTLGYSSFKWKN